MVDDGTYERLRDQIDDLADFQLGGIRDYLGKNPTIPSRLAATGPDQQLAAAQAVDAMYSADVAAAMARAGLRPDGSVEAMVAAVQCLIAAMYELRKLPAQVEVAIARANLELVRTEGEREVAIATQAGKLRAEVAKAGTHADLAELERSIAGLQGEMRQLVVQSSLQRTMVQVRRETLRNNDESMRLDAIEQTDDIYSMAYAVIARRQAIKQLRKASRPILPSNKLPKREF